MIKKGFTLFSRILIGIYSSLKISFKNNFCNPLIKENNTLYNPMFKTSKIFFGISLSKI